MRPIAGKPGEKCGLAFFCALFLFAATGCRSVEVHVASGVSPRAEWDVLMLPLDESQAERAAIDFTVYGRTGAQGSGAVVAREIASAFSACAAFHPVSPGALQEALQDEKLSPADLPALTPERACELGRRARANMVVLGKVLTYRNAWYLFVPRARVRFELRGLDPESGSELWSASAGRSATFSVDRTIASDLAADVAGQLRGRLCPGAASEAVVPGQP